MRAFTYLIFLSFALTFVATSARIFQPELKNVRAAIRQNRSTQADFQEERVIRLMNNPVLSSGTVSFQLPNNSRVKYWESIANGLIKAGWNFGCLSAN